MGDDLAFGCRTGVDLVAADDGLRAGPSHRVDVGDRVLEVGFAVARVPGVDDDGVGQTAGDDDTFDGASGRVEGERFGRHRDENVVGDVESCGEDVLVLQAAGGVDKDVLPVVALAEDVVGDGGEVNGRGGLPDAALLVGNDVDLRAEVFQAGEAVGVFVGSGEVEGKVVADAVGPPNCGPCGSVDTTRTDEGMVLRFRVLPRAGSGTRTGYSFSDRVGDRWDWGGFGRGRSCVYRGIRRS